MKRQTNPKPGEAPSDYMDRMLGKPGSAERKLGDTGAYERYLAIWTASQEAMVRTKTKTKATQKLLRADCMKALRKYRPNTFTAVVTDPPYGLGFLAKDWDHGVPGERFWKAIKRVSKPGAILLAFGGTRTYHRLACAIEDAGWEIRDCIMWVYGCLSEDTEVLTRDGWEHYHRIKGKEILTYDPKVDVYQWERPSRWSTYRVESDTAYQIQSDSTDQVVSRNHRCLVEREGKLVFVEAEKLSIMECVPTLPNDFFGLPEAGTEVLQSGVQRVLSGTGLGKARSQGGSSSNTRRSIVCNQEDDWSGQPSMEGWGNVLQTQGQVCQPVDQVRSMPAGVCVDGPQGRLCDGASVACCDGVGAGVDTGGVCSPRKPRCNRQSTGESDTLQVECRPQEVRTRTSYQTTLATVTAIHYSGMIFCPTVSTGAFVARRNGKVFLTGNSGFPKSHNISKALDKSASAEREVVGKTESIQFREQGRKTDYTVHSDDSSYGTSKSFGHGVDITTPSTKAAQLWDGWGTALKPAHEIILCCRKPLTNNMERGIIVENLSTLEAKLWSLLSAKVAKKHFKLSQVDYNAVCDSAQWSADERSSTRDALFAQTDTSQFASAVISSLSIVSWWRSILADNSEPTSTSTIVTESKQTTDWKTLKSCVSALTPLSIIQAELKAPGSRLNAEPAARYLNAVCLNIISTQELSVLESAISKGHISHQDDLGLAPNYEPIIVAMKPLNGTFAANALKHGVAGINVDGCRVGIATGDKNQSKTATPRNGPGTNKVFGKHEQINLQNLNKLGRFPANLILAYPEDSYTLRDDVTPKQLRALAEWLDENP